MLKSSVQMNVDNPQYTSDVEYLLTGRPDEFLDTSYSHQRTGGFLGSSLDEPTDADFDHHGYISRDEHFNGSMYVDAASAIPQSEVTSSQGIHSILESHNILKVGSFHRPSFNESEPTGMIPGTTSHTSQPHDHPLLNSISQVESFPWNEYVNDSMCIDGASANALSEGKFLQGIHTTLNNDGYGTSENLFSHIPVPDGSKSVGSMSGNVNYSSQPHNRQPLESMSISNQNPSPIQLSIDILSDSLAWSVTAAAQEHGIGNNQYDLHLDTSTEVLHVPLYKPSVHDGQDQVDPRQALGSLDHADFGSAEQVQHQNEGLPTMSTSPDGLQDHQVVQTPTGRSRFTEAQQQTLKLWFSNNIDNPYPDRDGMTFLANETKLSRWQIQNWFSRARQRELEHVCARIEVEIVQLKAQQLNTLSLEALPTSTKASWSFKDSDGALSNKDGHCDELPTTCDGQQPFNIDNKLEWWLGCLPDEAFMYDLTFCAPLIIKAPLTLQNPLDKGSIFLRKTSAEVVASHTTKAPSIADGDHLWHRNEHDEHHHRNDSRSSYGNASENDVSAFSGNSTRSKRSRASNISSYSAYSSTSLGPRKGRRRVVSISQRAATLRESGIIKRQAKFVCVFCEKSFSRKFACDRHVNSIHEPKTVWVCQEQLRLPTDGDMGILCSFCHQEPVQCTHNVWGCWDKRKEDRTYYRRDGFVQHLMGVHNLARADIAEINLQHWAEEIATDNGTRESEAASEAVLTHRLSLSHKETLDSQPSDSDRCTGFHDIGSSTKDGKSALDLSWYRHSAGRSCNDPEEEEEMYD